MLGEHPHIGLPLRHSVPESQMGFARLPQDAYTEVADNVIDLNDPAFALPRRSLSRRRTFQTLQNQYYRQLLHGCANPLCETSTCLSYQKRVSQQPFRAYTALSARSLATTLASNDHPEKGLCPYRKTDTDTLAVPALDRTHNGNHRAGKLDVAFESTSRHSKSRSYNHKVASQSTITSTAKANIQSVDKKAAVSLSQSNNWDRGAELGSVGRLGTRPGKKDPAPKPKDSKSFSQMLFDTSAMKTLLLPPAGVWAYPAKKEQNHDYRTVRTGSAKDRGRDCLSQTDIIGPLADGSHPQESVEMFDKEESSLKLNGSKARAQSKHQRTMSSSTDVNNVIKTEDSVLNSAHDLSSGDDKRDHSDATVFQKAPYSRPQEVKETLASPIESSLLEFEQPPSVRFLRDWKRQMSHKHEPCTSTYAKSEVESLQSSLKMGARRPQQEEKPTTDAQASGGKYSSLLNGGKDRDLCFAADNVEHRLISPPQSLSHFSAWNVRGLSNMAAQYHPNSFHEHRLLRSQGRIDNPLLDSMRSPEELERYRAFLSFVAQSISYVFTNTEALLRSFVDWDDDNWKIKSYDISRITYYCRLLRNLDFHPSRIFPSLWTTIAKFYPTRRSNATATTVFLSISACDHADTFHIIKIVFAALIASVPHCDTNSIIAIGKLRASGRTALPILCGEFEEHQLVSTELSYIEDAFEDEMAISVMTRLVKVIAARNHDYFPSRGFRTDIQGPDSGLNNDISCFFARIVQYVFGSHFMVLRGDKEACPTVQGGDLYTEGLPKSERRLPVLVVIQWLRTVLLKEWDGKARILRQSAAGGALGLLEQIFKSKGLLVEDELFHTPFLSSRLDVLDVPLEWMASEEDVTSVHVFSYPFLFVPTALIAYFRAINYDTMLKAFKDAMAVEQHASKLTYTDSHTGRGKILLQERLKDFQRRYLVIEVRRDNVLTDAMNQLWRRHKSELMKPLKVRMGTEEGEEGLDHGGVQQEFFRVAVADAMNPDYGAFVTDSNTHLSWFQAGSLEPSYKFELLGLLTSLAVYNGLTLPFTFPLALYRKMLGLSVTELDDIEDGWPEKTNGMKKLRDWPKDDVEEVFSIPYVFSVDSVFGTTIDVDMKRASASIPAFKNGHPGRKIKRDSMQRKSHNQTRSPLAKERGQGQYTSKRDEKFGGAQSRKETTTPASEIKQDASIPPLDGDNRNGTPYDTTSESRIDIEDGREPIMVTNANREQYIRDYIAHLTHHSIEKEWNAFQKGFFKCISRKSISLFSPSQLKALVEGLPDINVEELEAITTYDGGYYYDHPTIRHFWAVVGTWPQETLRKLLEFVTASDRLPAGGMNTITFEIIRNGTGDNGWLPSSSTCFSRLLLPDYNDEERLRRSLEMVVEHSKGFGMV